MALHLQLFTRGTDSDKVQTCTNIQDRTDWTPEDAINQKQMPAEFDCGGEHYALDFVDKKNPRFPDGRIHYKLVRKAGSEYVDEPEMAQPGVPSPFLVSDNFVLYIGPDKGPKQKNGPRHNIWFPNQAAMKAYVMRVRANEPGARHTTTTSHTTTAGFWAPALSAGPRFITDGGESSTLNPPSIVGNTYTPEQHVLSGAGFTFALDTIPGINLYDPTDVVAGWISFAGSVVNLPIEFSWLSAQGNEHVSGDPGQPASMSRWDLGLHMRFAIDWRAIEFVHNTLVRHDREQAALAQKKILPANAWDPHYWHSSWSGKLFAETDLLVGGEMDVNHWNFKGSSKPADAHLHGLYTPFQRWTVGGTVEYAFETWSLGLTIAGWLPATYSTSDGLALEDRGLEARLEFKLFPNTVVQKEVHVRINDTIKIGRPAPIHVVQAPKQPEPPKPDEPVEVSTVKLADLSGLEEKFITLYPEGKIVAIDETAATNAFGRLIQKMEKALGLPIATLLQQGWKIVLVSRGHANSTGSVTTNNGLSMGRAHGVNGKLADLAVEKKFPLESGSIRAIGRGEYELTTPEKTIVVFPAGVNPDRCTGPNGPNKTRTHKCRGVDKFVEDLVLSRNVESTLTALPPGSPNFTETEGVDPKQLAIDHSTGPRIAKALQGKNKFTFANYEPTANRLYVGIDSLDPKKLATWKRLLDTVSGAKKVSFTVEPMLQMEVKGTPSESTWRDQVKAGLYKFGQSPWAGGLDPSLASTKSKLATLVNKAKEIAKAAKTISDAMVQSVREIGDIAVYHRAWNSKALPKADRKAFYQLGKTLLKDSAGKSVVVIVNRGFTADPKATATANQEKLAALKQQLKAEAAGVGYAVQSGFHHPVQTRITTDPRLPNDVMVVALPKGSKVEVDQPSKPETKAFFDQLKTK